MDRKGRERSGSGRSWGEYVQNISYKTLKEMIKGGAGRERRERESYDLKPECLGWSVNSDKGKLLVCEGLQNGGS